MEIATLNNEIHHKPIKEFLNELSIKIFIDITIKKVYFYEDGSIKPFKELPQKLIEKLTNSLLEDTVALRKLKDLPSHQILESFAFQVFSSSYMPIAH